MRKTIYTYLCTGMLFLANLSYGQLASWPLTEDGSGVNVNANVVAGDFMRGPGVGDLLFTPGTGVWTRGWTLNPHRNELDYFEFCISAVAGTPHITSLEFEVWQGPDGPTRFDLFSSTDGFLTRDSITSANSEDPDYSPLFFIDAVDEKICGSTEMCFRIYAYQATHPNGFFGIAPNSLHLFGSVPNLCTPPTEGSTINYFTNVTTSSITLNVTTGNGFKRLIAVRPGSPVAARPCDGVNYGANPTFGSPNGSYLSDGSYVVYNFGPAGSSFNLTVNGLEEGTTYHFAVFEASITDCFNASPGVNVQTTDCTVPTDVAGITTDVSDGTVYLNWEVPMCNEVMIVASPASVTGVPSGTGGNYDPAAQYGAGMDLNDPQHFATPEFIVFKDMNTTSATITGLTNEVTYYFRFFSRLGTDWTPGVEVTAVPTRGCPELGGNDVVFINEVHHYIFGENRGVELFGPAGFDLSGYQIIFYEQDGLAYDTLVLSGLIPDLEDSGYGVVWFPYDEMGPGRDAIALYNGNEAVVVEYINYRGAQILALNSVAEGMTSLNINGAGNRNASQQLIGTGRCPSDFIWVTASPVTPGEFNVGQVVFPVEWVYFEGEARDGQVWLDWQTAVEINNDYFVVERAADGRAFTEIGRVAGAGTTQDPRDYRFVDRDPLAGVSYYRLRQVDLDGRYDYSRVIAVAFDRKENALLLYPTATTGQLQLSLAATLVGEGELRVFSLAGQLLLRTTLPADSREQSLDVSFLPAGSYFLQLKDRKETLTGRFVKHGS